PTTPGPSAPGAPSPAGPTTPGPAAPGFPGNTGGLAPGGGPAAGPKTGPRGIQIGEDLSRWQIYWEFNKDRFLELRDSIHAPAVVSGSDEFYLGASRRIDAVEMARPSDHDVRTRVLPALRDALARTTQRDMVSSCLMALAKVGRDHPGFPVLHLLSQQLKTHDQEIRETAALAMGLCGSDAALEPLCELALDLPAGRTRLDRARVDFRTRSFALWGLAVLANHTRAPEVARRAAEVAQTVLRDDRSGSANVHVAAIHLLGLVAPRGRAGADALRAEAVRILEAYFDRAVGPQDEFVQAHAPTALVRLLGRGDTPAHRRLKAKLVGLLNGRIKRGRRTGSNILRSAALALGELSTSDAADAAIHEALRNYVRSGKDAQARYFAMIAMAYIGGAGQRTELLQILQRGNKSLDRPWAALALGITEFLAARRTPGKSVDSTIGEALRAQLLAAANPEARGAFAIALGLCRYRPAGDQLLGALAKHRQQDEVAGYLCIGLSLMGHRRALPAIQEVVARAMRRPELLRQAATALGKLGDRNVTASLLARLDDGDPNIAKLGALSTALGFIGDRRTLTPLLKLLTDEQRPGLSRTFAAVALGMVCDRSRLPWNAMLAANLNYRAAVETLTQSGTGVIDIL
ncbi:MAG: HEAT repeat domain-containing protein, partial [Planctomycetes bacterium]|nr:HEAT repeat domain-containing protein [Planctomycetota bacterium]